MINPQLLKRQYKISTRKFTHERRILEEIGRKWIEVIKKEIKADIAKRKGVLSLEKESLPTSKDFANSFSYRITGQNIDIYTNWPFLERHTEGREPYKMNWLRGGTKKNPKIVPIWDSETKSIKFRRAPYFTEESWVHPGVAKSNFLERAKTIMIEEEIPKIIMKAASKK